MLPLLLSAALIGQPDAQQLAGWGRETIELIRRDYYIPGSKLYAEDYQAGRPSTQPCFNWASGVLLSALNAAARNDPKYRPWLKEYADAVQVYWNPKGPVPGYDVLPAPKPVDRYYDDNAWMVLALVETYEVLQEAKYLNRAEDALKYVLSGEDEKLGGGIYWRESDKASKNTCSNGPSAAAALAVYKHRKRPEYLSAARRLYDWTRRNLRDPNDGLYWDNQRLTGEIEKTKWTYNSGLMLRTSLGLKHGDSAELLEASKRRWLRSGTIADEGKFAHLLLEAWLQAEGGQVYQIEVMNSVRNLRARSGHYPGRWDRAALPDQERFALIDQASAARGYFMVAESLLASRRR